MPSSASKSSTASARNKRDIPEGFEELLQEPTCTDVWCPDESSQDEAEEEMKGSTQ